MKEISSKLNGEGLNTSEGELIWNDCTLLPINKKKIEKFNLPLEDFSNEKYDTESGEELEQVFLLLSTPRSGSTAVCDYLFKSAGFITHEYFQKYQHMPYLASRWGAVSNGKLDAKAYFQSLLKFRVRKDAILGVNLHGGHIGIFSYFEKYFICDYLPKTVLVLRRRNKIEQAVSYFLASKTERWSTYFDAKGSIPKYSFMGIKSKLLSIMSQETMMDSYLAEKPFLYQTIFYEDLIKRPEYLQPELSEKIKIDAIDISQSRTSKQADSVNQNYVERFEKELGLIN